MTASAANLAYTKVGGETGGYERPVCGVININMQYHKDFLKWDTFNKQERQRTFFHEMTHALAFSPILAKKFITPSGEIIKEEIIEKMQLGKLSNMPVLNHPYMREPIEQYFKCNEKIGYHLAQKDSAHFHQQLIANTIMRPMADNFEMRISVFMLQLFHISGWYRVDLNKKEINLWGKDKGCNFLKLQCEDENGKTFSEYCDLKDQPKKIGCDYYYQSPSVCNKAKRLKDIVCPWMVPMKRLCHIPDSNKKALVKGLKEKFSPESKCVEFLAGPKRLSGCFEAKCDKNAQTITIKVGDQEYTNRYKDGKSETEFFEAEAGPGKLKFYFPDYNRFCFNIYNPKDAKPFRKTKKRARLFSRIFE